MYRDSQKGLCLDLASADGNVFALMGYAQSFAAQLGKDPKPILKEMRSSDYRNAVAVFEREFPFVTLINKEIVLPDDEKGMEDD